MRAYPRISVTLTVVLALAVAVVSMPGVAASGIATSPPTPGGAQSNGTYSNPVTGGFSADFPDPAVIKGKDGYWYAFATGGPYDEAGTTGDPFKIARSEDLVTWERVGSVFDGTNRPEWADPGSGFWAPDIRYINGRYVLYFSVHNTTETPQNWDYAIGVATAPTPGGPWTDSGAPIVGPRPAAGGGFQWTIDPAAFVDDDGQRYLYWGSYNGGLHAVPITPDGLRTDGAVTQVGSERFEAPYVVRHDERYYLFASSSNCCAGPTTGYAVFVGRADNPMGPFTDRQGASLMASRTGGTPVVSSNGNRWVGAGHPSIVTDLAGQMWLAHHGVDRTDPYVENSNNWLLRPMLLDRLDWIDGWPVVNAGAGTSDGRRGAPTTRGVVHDTFDSADDTGTAFSTVSGTLAVQADDLAGDAGGFARLDGETLAVIRTRVPSDTRVEADVRVPVDGEVGVVVRYRSPRSHVRVVADAATLRVEIVEGGRTDVAATVPLPPTFTADTWHTLSVHVRGQRLTAQLDEARLAEPAATLAVELPRRLSRGNRAGLTGAGTADADNFSAAALQVPVTDLAPLPRIGEVDPAYSDEFDGDLEPEWTWRNVDPDAEVNDGHLTWPTQTADLTNDTAAEVGLLLRDQPEGEFVVETKLGLDVGTETVRNFQQAGLLVYVDDENWLRLDHVAGGALRVVEFGKRMRLEDTTSVGDPVTFGGAIIGPPGDTTWLRLAHDIVPETGEHRYRAASSTDGDTWVWGAAWTLPADDTPRIGLVSHGSTAAAEAEYGAALARFDYFRVSR